MDYTQSNSYDTDGGTGLRMHEDAKAVPTVWSGKDANSIIWSLMEVVKAAGLTGLQFDKANPASYQLLLKALRSLDTFASVPTTFCGYEITVTQPHLRKMVWTGTAYRRADWHQPGMVQYSYDNPSTIPGFLPIRADLVYNQASYPDLVARLGLTGTGTFSLIDLRGEFIRCLDNLRGVDVGRALRSAQAGDNKPHTHGATQANHNHPLSDYGHVHSGWTDTQGWHDHESPFRFALNLGTTPGSNGAEASVAGGGAFPRTGGGGSHGHNIGIGTSGAGITLGASGAAITVAADGSEARPRNVALTAWVSY